MGDKTDIRFRMSSKHETPGREDRLAGGFAMQNMQTVPAQASRPNQCTAPQNEYVVRRLDQLEELGRYSVVYEITRIETILTHMFHQDGLLPT